MRLDGTIVPVEVTATRYRGGDVAEMQVIAVDITERKQAALEAAAVRSITNAFLESATLQDSCSRTAQLLSEALETAFVAVYGYDPQTEELAWIASNDAPVPLEQPLRTAVPQFLASRAAESGQTVAILDVSQVTEPATDIARARGLRTVLCIPMKSRDGVLGVLALGDRRLRPDLLRRKTQLEVVADHLLQETARRRAEEALRISERRHRALFDQMPVGLWEEDGSEVKRLIDEVLATGVTDLREYLQENPEFAFRCATSRQVCSMSRSNPLPFPAPRRPRSPESPPATISGSPYATTVAGWTPPLASASSSPTSPPRRCTRGPASACRSSTAS